MKMKDPDEGADTHTPGHTHCHALVLVFCVFFIILVRPGCDMGLLCGVFCLGVFVGIGIVA